MCLIAYRGLLPILHPSVFVAPGARVIGDVQVGARSSLWFGAVVRGDVNRIRIGEETNLQDGTVVHVTHGTHPTIIGNRVTVGHGAMIHGCRLEDLCLVGIGAVVLDGAVVGERAMVGAGALVTPGTQVPPETLVLGTPARVARGLLPDELCLLEASAQYYVELAASYPRGGAGEGSSNTPSRP
jgi:carbonic anhydrase/acetyltransferase-like protein (isoleucine patch superfamily)